MEEIWKDIAGYEGLYQVSNLGNVRSLDRLAFNGKQMCLVIGKDLKLRLQKNGYVRVSLSKGSKIKYCNIHRLVAEAFIPNPNNLPEVNHKDEDKTNNRVENLEYCDRKYNNNYGSRIERGIEKRINHPKLCKPILQFSLSGDFIKEYPSQKEAQRQTGVINQNIYQCCNGKRKQAGGYIWRYKKEQD